MCWALADKAEGYAERNVKIGVVQLAGTSLEVAERFVQQAAEDRPDVLVLPEVGCGQEPQELADSPLPQMIYFWDALEQEQQSALSLLGEVLEDSSRYASAQMLVNLAREQNLELVGTLSSTPLPELEQALDELFVREVLERERAGEGQYEYRFRVDLFRLWVREAHSIWQQA